MPKVNREALGGCWMWFPKLEEQDAILRFVAKASSPSDFALEHAERQIDVLREYRTRLIADVVTGQFDVREAAERLPDAIQEAEPLYADTDDAGSIEAAGDSIEAEP